MKAKGILFVVSAPSGAGKTTLSRKITEIVENIHHWPTLKTVLMVEKVLKEFFNEEIYMDTCILPPSYESTLIKQETKARSHDEVIKTLISDRKKIPCSMFGSNRKLNSFSEKDEAEFHDL